MVMCSHSEIYSDIYSEPCSYKRVGVKLIKCDLKKNFGGFHGHGGF